MVEVKLFPFFNLSTRCGWVANTSPQLLYPQEKAQVQMYRRLGGHQSWSGQVWKILCPLGFESQIVQSVESHYTNYNISEKLMGK